MIERVRTTIEIDDDIRLELLRIAAERGEKGYSGVINEVLRKGLRDEGQEERERKAAVIRSLKGSISEESAEAMHASVRETRTQWRTES
jgi:metal-responsive CopG/Arc/MetJ family transcriptional regulator